MRAKVATLVALVSACSTVPAYRRPDSPVPVAWSGAAAGQIAADPGWWRSFGSPELDALIARGGSGNHDLQAAVARVEQARARAEIAGAPRYPAIDVGAAIARGSGSGQARSQSLLAGASYEVDFWGKNRAAAGSAGALADASALDAQTVTLTLQAIIADTYFQVLSLDARLRLARRIADAARQVLGLVEAQAAGGVASDLEVEQQRNAVATFDAAVPALQQQLDQGLHALAVLTGEAPEAFRADGGAVDHLSIPQVQAGLPATVLERRPDIRAAEARLVSANFDVGAARAAFFPSLTLTGQAGVGNPSLSRFLPPVAIWSVVANLVQPVFEGGRLRGQLRLDRARYVELAATYRQTVLTALREVEDALTAVRQLEALERTDEVAVESARRASTLASAQYEAGVADFLTVLTTERTLYQAEDVLLQVRLERLQAAVGLFRALGGGFGTTEGKAS